MNIRTISIPVSIKLIKSTENYWDFLWVRRLYQCYWKVCCPIFFKL